MANGYFERGEVYWVRMDNGFGGEQGVGRPGLIVSCDASNSANETVTVAFLTTKYWPGKNRVQIEATGTTSYVIHNQLMTYDKSRLGKFIGVLNSAEQKAVDDVLEKYLDLGYVDDTALKEKDREIEARNAVIAEKDAEIAKLKARLLKEEEKAEKAELSYKVENAMWQKLYEKALNQVVDMKYTNDLFLKNHLDRNDEPPVEEPESPKEPEPPADGRVDINSCTITSLKKIGFSLPMAKKIVDGRPYNAVTDLKNGFGIKATQYKIMEPKLKCTPIPEELPVEEAVVEKVNVNTVTSALQLTQLSGMNQRSAQGILRYSKEHGPFVSLDDLLKVPEFGKTCLRRYGDKLEV